jgi:predicted ABC-type sugar transport system permease subunit
MRAMTLGLIIGMTVGIACGWWRQSLALGVMIGIGLGALLGKVISKYHLRSTIKTALRGGSRPEFDGRREE